MMAKALTDCRGESPSVELYKAYGTRLREALRALFGVIHRREQLTAEQFQSQLESARAEVLRCGPQNVPETKHCRNLAKRFEKHGESYFRFITTSGVEPTNNLTDLDSDRDLYATRAIGV
jgi:hypothetical protein